MWFQYSGITDCCHLRGRKFLYSKGENWRFVCIFGFCLPNTQHLVPEESNFNSGCHEDLRFHEECTVFFKLQASCLKSGRLQSWIMQFVEKCNCWLMPVKCSLSEGEIGWHVMHYLLPTSKEISLLGCHA